VPVEEDKGHFAHNPLAFSIFSENFKTTLKQIILIVLQPFGDPK
jgi:hypothetical protein